MGNIKVRVYVAFPLCRLFIGARVYNVLTFYAIGAIVVCAHYKLIREIAGIVAKHGT